VKNNGTTLYVANLGFRAVEEDLEERFTVFGPIEKLELMKDPYSKESRGFAFVTYKDQQDANDAQRKMDGATMNGRSIRVEFSKRKVGHTKTPGYYAGPATASKKYGLYSQGGPPPRSSDRGGTSYSRVYDRDYDRRGNSSGGYTYERDYTRDRSSGYDEYDRKSSYDDYDRRRPPPPRRY